MNKHVERLPKVDKSRLLLTTVQLYSNLWRMDPVIGLRPQTPITGALQLYLGASNSLTPALIWAVCLGLQGAGPHG